MNGRNGRLALAVRALGMTASGLPATAAAQASDGWQFQ